jgi:anti-anti-sigma factor
VTASEPFSVVLEHRGTTLVAVPSGELDLSTSPQLARKLQAHEDYDELVIDLRELSFMDSSGVRLLVAEHERASRQGHALRIVRGNPEVHRVLRVTRLDERLPLVEEDELDVHA